MSDTLDELVDKAKKNDNEAFTALYKTVYKDLYHFAYYTLRSPEDAEDVVGDTVVAAYESIGKLREATLFRNWIFKILINKCKTKMRQYYKNTVELNENDSTYTPNYDSNHDLKNALNCLTKEERLIVSLSAISGYKGEEIAKMLNIKHSTIRSKYRRALVKMQNYMEKGAQ